MEHIDWISNDNRIYSISNCGYILYLAIFVSWCESCNDKRIAINMLSTKLTMASNYELSMSLFWFALSLTDKRLFKSLFQLRFIVQSTDFIDQIYAPIYECVVWFANRKTIFYFIDFRDWHARKLIFSIVTMNSNEILFLVFRMV